MMSMRFALLCPARALLLAALISALPRPAFPQDPAPQITVDLAAPSGLLRPLHGINKGPLAPGGLIDLTAPLRAINSASPEGPFARLHDCHWPNPDVVDIHAVFPNFAADPSLESSYDFALTDEYIAATQRTGAQIVYRLGESIEHNRHKRFVHPPSDPERWAAICLGIIRHYNEGWARGAHYNIRYWEIWNEPENRPAMWTGSDEDYFRLYRSAASAIKGRYPHLKVGGPALGYTGQWQNGVFRPGSFLTNFLAFCRRESLPLDFFSWHCYTAQPEELVARARAIRRLLDEYGFKATESHLNEWNYLPGNTWKPISRSSPPEVRQRFYDEMSGAGGAAFIVAALIGLQDAPVDVCNFFHGELGGFGLFNEHGVPQKSYHAFRAFNSLLETPRAAATRAPAGIAALAGLAQNRAAAAILISNFAGGHSRMRIALSNMPWTGQTITEVLRLTASEDLPSAGRTTNSAGPLTLKLDLEKPAVALIRLWPADVASSPAKP